MQCRLRRRSDFGSRVLRDGCLGFKGFTVSDCVLATGDQHEVVQRGPFHGSLTLAEWHSPFQCLALVSCIRMPLSKAMLPCPRRIDARVCGSQFQGGHDPAHLTSPWAVWLRHLATANTMQPRCNNVSSGDCNQGKPGATFPARLLLCQDAPKPSRLADGYEATP